MTLTEAKKVLTRRRDFLIRRIECYRDNARGDGGRATPLDNDIAEATALDQAIKSMDVLVSYFIVWVTENGPLFRGQNPGHS